MAGKIEKMVAELRRAQDLVQENKAEEPARRRAPLPPWMIRADAWKELTRSGPSTSATAGGS